MNYKFYPLMIQVNDSIHEILQSEEGTKRLKPLASACAEFSNWLINHPDYKATEALFDPGDKS